MSVEAPEAPSAPAPVTTEPQASPAADTSTPANPTTPVGEAAPASQKLSRGNPLPTPEANPEAQRKAAFEAMQNRARERGTQVVREPAKEKTAATSTPASKEEGAGNRVPKEASTATKEPEGDKGSKDAIIVKGTDKDGKAADVTITRQQAVQALLRSKIPADAIAEWSNKRVLEIGSQQFLLQQENDRKWSQLAEERRRGAEAKEPQPSPASASPPPAQAATPEASKEQPPAQTAQPSSAQSQPTPPTNDFEADFKAIEEEVGASAAAPFRSLLSKVTGAADKAVAAQQQRVTQLESTVQNLQQVNAGLINMALDERFDRGFRDLEKDFPQLEGDSEDAQKLRADIRANADSIQQSGRWKNPWDMGAFREILREAAFARLGKQQQETHARQLLRRQETQAKGQVPANPSRTENPSASLSDTEIKKRAMLETIRTGSREKGQKLMRELSQASG